MDKIKIATIMANPKTKIIVIAVITALIIALGILIYKKLTKVSDNVIDAAANNKLIQEANKSIVVSDITIPQDQFDFYASKLYTSMKGPGTNEKAIYAVFEALTSRSDVMQLIKTYGLKDNMTLVEWINSELNAKELEHLNSILSSKSIQLQF